MKNENHAKDQLSNQWDYDGIGNYWDDYTFLYPNATAINGVWDTPYIISSTTTKNVQDDFPLVKPIDL